MIQILSLQDRRRTKQAKVEADSSELIWVKATAKAIENFTTMMIPADYPSQLKLHEQYLADHVMWAQEALGGKTMVWAHNLHVAKGVIDQSLYPYGAGILRYVPAGAVRYCFSHSQNKPVPYQVRHDDNPFPGSGNGIVSFRHAEYVI